MDRHSLDGNISFGVITEVVIQEQCILSATGFVENLVLRFVTIICVMLERGPFLCLTLFSCLGFLDSLVRI